MEIRFEERKQLKEKPDQKHLGFGKYMTDYMFIMDWGCKDISLFGSQRVAKSSDLNGSVEKQLGVARHSKRTNAVYADGHAAPVDYRDLSEYVRLTSATGPWWTSFWCPYKQP